MDTTKVAWRNVRQSWNKRIRASWVTGQTKGARAESPSPYKYSSVKDELIPTPSTRSDESTMDPEDSAVLHRSLRGKSLNLSKGSGIRLFLENGGSIIDASGGASVACIGHGDARVRDAMVAQLDKVAYCATAFYTTGVCEELGRELVDSTNGRMSRAYIVCSGKLTRTLVPLAKPRDRDLTPPQDPRRWRLP